MDESINRTEKRSRGRPRTDPVSIHLTLPPADVAALDAHIAAQPDPKPTRPEAIRRVLAKTLGSGKPAKAPAKPAGATEPAVAEKAARARSKAASAADEALKGVDAPVEVKAARRKALTEKPAMVAKARTKGLPR